MYPLAVHDAIAIREVSSASLADYGGVSSAFTVTARVRVDGGGLRGGELEVERVEPPYLKDYDAGGGPEDWGRRWDVSRWGVLAAQVMGQRIGGAVVAWRTEGVDMLEARDDLAVLWDLRVSEAFRQRGAGRRLVLAAAEWARQRGCRELKIETQDVNVAACRCYAGMGATLSSVRAGMYAAAPAEVQLIWRLQFG